MAYSAWLGSYIAHTQELDVLIVPYKLIDLCILMTNGLSEYVFLVGKLPQVLPSISVADGQGLPLIPFAMAQWLSDYRSYLE